MQQARAASKAVMTQYISLMIMILTFVTGSFVTRAMKPEDLRKAPPSFPLSKPSRVSSPSTISTSISDELPLTEIFPNATELGSDEADSLATVLRAHDVSLRATLSPKKDLGATLRQAATFYNALLARGVPPATVSVGVQERGNSGVWIEWERENVP